uniref:Uncharacterized protein n=1 Tax=Chromera velia CCMP2878 TaxID=1169474 RepID=A0A0G4HGN6_9ALVE|eukprot:Cvel_27334.t1-p1 / transcript=Cvel_27334.t1 / gene=Cvel_27334 / organism=Chromera_velia_CCMP2878 / gene_product=5-azacytidine-induced protein 1, putative / transcript_product=5-azacytidine-induced protein 1, putative / location=Cvel_scaffold3392:8162-14222(-) / protein_length=740 / sequence_SO=supercontig / SO=protein_coding / is_pseudo=false
MEVTVTRSPPDLFRDSEIARGVKERELTSCQTENEGHAAPPPTAVTAAPSLSESVKNASRALHQKLKEGFPFPPSPPPPQKEKEREPQKDTSESQSSKGKRKDTAETEAPPPTVEQEDPLDAAIRLGALRYGETPSLTFWKGVGTVQRLPTSAQQDGGAGDDKGTTEKVKETGAEREPVEVPPSYTHVTGRTWTVQEERDRRKARESASALAISMDRDTQCVSFREEERQRPQTQSDHITAPGLREKPPLSSSAASLPPSGFVAADELLGRRPLSVSTPPGDAMPLAGRPPPSPSPSSFPPPASSLDAGSCPLEFQRMKSRMSVLEIEVDDKRKIIARLKESLEEAKRRAKTAETEFASTDEALRRAREEKQNLEEFVKRQLQMADGLVKDKAELTQRVEKLAEEVRAVRTEQTSKLHTQAEAHRQEVERSRRQWEAAERQRRERWEEEKTKEIKENTIRGLEPQVELILSEQRQQKRQFEERLREEAVAERRRMEEEMEERMRKAKTEWRATAEKEMQSERESLQRRMMEQFDRLDEQVQEERESRQASVRALREENEKERRAEAESWTQKIEDARKREREAVEQRAIAAETKLEAALRRHKNDLSGLQEQLRLEKHEWLATMTEKLGKDKRKELEEFKKDLNKEKERQLEQVVDLLAKEQQQRHKADLDRIRQDTENAASSRARVLAAELEAERERRQKAEQAAQASSAASAQLEERAATLTAQLEEADALLRVGFFL